ncbi:MAG: aldehyde ferredoxin oxidoreductase N-terminal domain-containing protein [Chloroflexota bacterium]
MAKKVVNVSRFPALSGWVNRILRIDLSDMTIDVQETAPYVPDFLGARGIAAKIAWDEYPEPVETFDPRNPLMIFPGALTGTRSPYSGRTNICAFSPQSYPYHFFTRSNVGSHFGGELKRAGYDGIVVTGASETPVRLRIHDDEVSILPADDFWGHHTLDTLDALESTDGEGTRSLVIGPAGERLSRIATIHAASSSACGQGGFGAVMGSKRLKAISVMGTGKVPVADAERLNQLTREVGEEARTMWNARKRIERLNETMAEEGIGRVRPYACTEACVSPCNLYYQNVPGRAHDCKYSGHWACVGSIFRGMGPKSDTGGVFDWQLGTRGGLEMNVLSNRYGLNQWELIIGMVPWLEACQDAGLISELNGEAMDWQSPDFWAHFLKALAYREGMGDVLAEGGWAAAQSLSLGEELVRRYYTGWGYSGHWDGHGSWSNHIIFPFWLVSALQWLTDTRDPIPSGHGYVHGVMNFGPANKNPIAGSADNPITWDHMRGIAERIYHDSDALDPFGGYNAKGYPGFFHTKRSVMKDCLPVDDFVFPMIYSPNTEDHFCRIGDIPGTSVEYHLFKAGTGTDWTEDEFERAAERIYTLERALTIRHWCRDRKMDEMVLPSFEYKENWINPFLEERHGLDRKKFAPVMEEFYELQGWDPDTGWPTKGRLDDLDLEDVYEPMVEGAARADEELPEPPEAGAVSQSLVEE